MTLRCLAHRRLRTLALMAGLTLYHLAAIAPFHDHVESRAE